MAGLFTTPAQQRAAEAKARAQHATQFMGQDTPIAGSLFNFGDAVGRSIAKGLFGLETRSAAELKAEEVQSTMQGIDWGSYDDVIGAAQKFAPSHPQAALQLIQHANQLPTTTKQTIDWKPVAGISGMLFPHSVSKTMRGSSVIEEIEGVGSGVETMERLIERAGLSSSTPNAKFSGYNIKLGEDNLPVWIDESGVGYIPDATKENGRDYETVLNNKEPMTKVNLQADATVSDTTKANRAKALSVVKKAVASKDNFFKGTLRKVFNLGAEDMKLTALQLEEVATRRWNDLSREDQTNDWGDNVANYMGMLLKSAENEDGSLNINHPLFFILSDGTMEEGSGTQRQRINGKPNQQRATTEEDDLSDFTIIERKTN